MSDVRCSPNWSLIGHQSILDFLTRSLANRRVSHAYLFVGPRQVGKTAVAKQLAQFVICDNYLADKPVNELGCGQCNACRHFEKGMYPDFHILECDYDEKKQKRKSIISVSQVRELQERLNKHAFMNSFKVVFIPEAEKMNAEASNSLLKTLEEPNPNTVMILLAPNVESVLPTIMSRCQTFHFLPVERKVIYDYLVAENVSRPLAKSLAAVAQGRPTVARELWQEPALYAEYQERAKTVFQLLFAKTSEKFTLIDSLTQKDADPTLFPKLLELGMVTVRDLLLYQTNQPDRASHSFMDEAYRAVIARQKTSYHQLETFAQAQDYLKQHIHPKFVLEYAFIAGV